MDEMNNERKETVIDVQRLVGAVWNRIWMVAVVAVLAAVLTFLYTFYFVTPMYQSSAMFYVNNSDLSIGNTSLSITNSDITASKNLVNSYIVILKTRESLNEVIDYAGVKRTYSELSGMISATSVNNTEIFRVTVTSPDPQEARDIANAIAYVLPKRISTIIEGTSAKVVDNAIVPVSTSSPNYTNNTIIGFLAGLVITIAIIVLKEIFDITIRTEEDIAISCKHPILASVPDMNAPSRGGDYYYYGYGSRRRTRPVTNTVEEEQKLIGSEINFSASESYKLLRTKLQFAFSDEKKSHVIGITSALTGEGKSLSATNLACMLAQLDKKVILIDCDMRRPSLAAKMPIEKSPGLSDFLSGQIAYDKLIQNCGLKNEEDAFQVVAAGRNPPNPVELLSSVRMNRLLETLRQTYEYIILDLPPVGEVSDALAVAEKTDGILLVVRQNYCNRLALNDTVHQFEFIGAKILGLIFNCTNEQSKGYGYRKNYYKRYNRRYYRRYEGSYANTEKAHKKVAVAEKQDQK